MGSFLFAKIMEIKDRLKKLTAQEIQELNVHAAQRMMLENTNLLIDLEKELFDASRQLGEARIKVEQLKSYKSAIVETNRALKAVIQSG